ICQSGETNATIFRNLMIRNGVNGMRISGSSPLLYNCHFEDNTGDDGGGMRIVAGTPKLQGCVFRQNSATYGGGMSCDGGSPEVSNCQFTSNSATEGGGMYGREGSLVLQDCAFEGNTADFGGGFRTTSSSAELVDCLFRSNAAELRGAGVYSQDGSLGLSCCEFRENSQDDSGFGFPSVEDGGGGMHIRGAASLVDCTFVANQGNRGAGLYVVDGDAVVIDQCRFEANEARITNPSYPYGWGGGIGVLRSDAIISQCVFAENKAGQNGGGFDNNESSPVITDCIFEGNIADSWGGGFMSFGGSPEIRDSEFRANEAGTGGGGFNTNSGSPSLLNCDLTENAAADGGALFGWSGITSVVDCRFLSNTATSQGGAVWVRESSHISFAGCDVIGNQASSTGGGIFVEEGASVNVGQSEICGNVFGQLIGAWNDDGENCVAELCRTCRDGCQDCPEGAVQWRVEDGGNGHWYHGIAGIISWTEARQRALAYGGDLVALEDPGEFQALIDLVLDPNQGSLFHPSNNWGPHIGGLQDAGARDFAEPAGGWLWLTGVGVDCTASPCVLDNCCGGQDRLALSSDPSGSFDYSFNDTAASAASFAQPGYVIEWSADCNGDGIVDYGQIRDGTFADEDGNGIPDDCEFAPDPCPTDLDQNGITDGGDLGAFFIFWGECQVDDCPADFNDDEVVDGIDLGILFSAWGPCQ
ncbi:right-handed parallel beta-helix repeat-containing protein, partial [bacterium]|nr:right-handed parallel beta-helix repeat-containing protein [bacterium]